MKVNQRPPFRSFESRLVEGDVAGVGTKEEIAAAFIPFLQDILDVRQKLNTLPGGSPAVRDPARTTDPALPWLFWDPSAIEGGGNLANTDLVGRSVIVENVVWNGSEYVGTLRRVR